MTRTLVLCFLLGTAAAFREFQGRIPNGDRIPDPCHANKLWQGVGHKQLGGGGERNPFGKDFEVAGKVTEISMQKRIRLRCNFSLSF